MIPDEWTRSSFCNGASSCVEVRRLSDGRVVVRDGKDPDGPVLVLSAAEWAAFVAGVKDGEFDVSALPRPGGDGPGRPPESTLTASGGDSVSRRES